MDPDPADDPAVGLPPANDEPLNLGYDDLPQEYIEEMNRERANFRNRITTVVGISVQQANCLITQDITMSAELSYVDDDTLMSCFPANDKPTVGKKSSLLAFRNWIKNQQANEGYDNVRSDDFTRYELHRMLEQAGTSLKRAPDGSDRLSGKEIKEPDPWSGKPQDWRKKKQELLAYLAKRRNRNGVPFLYLTRDEDYSEIDGDNSIDNDATHLIKNTPLHGTIFQVDNYNLFQVLVSWTSGGTMEAIVDRHRTTSNGRAAWSIIVSVMDGQDSKNARIRDADIWIDRAFYKDKRSQFSFDQYCAIHITSNMEMEERL